MMIAASDDWQLKEVAKSFYDLHLYACKQCMVYIKSS
jgi:hypothetical protein